MKTNMEMLNANVSHEEFGTGKVALIDSTIITVNFPNYGERRFVYPDAFDKFLKMCDPALDAIVTADLNLKKAGINAEKARLKKVRAEEVKCITAEKEKLHPSKRKAALKVKPRKPVKTEVEQNAEDETWCRG